MTRNSNFVKAIIYIASFILVFSLTAIVPPSAFSATNDNGIDKPWTIYYRPGVRFGSDDRTLYINDFLIPIYQDPKNILFNNTKFTPNDQDGWEVNVGLGYRRLFLDNKLILGINGFYDQRKTPWGTFHEQWGVGAEVMGDVPGTE